MNHQAGRLRHYHDHLAAALALALLIPVSVSLAQNANSEFKNIFNGKDLNDWSGNPDLWSVKDGAIVGRTTTEHPTKGNTFLIWKGGEVSDFELRLSYLIAPENDKGFANSGIQYRSQVLDEKNWVVGGYQADMEAGPNYSGILYEERMTRGIMAARGEKVTWDKDCKKQVTGSTGSSDEIQAAIKKEDWNDYVIIAKGNRLQHFINGKLTVDVTDECASKAAKSGVLALQLHAGPPMLVKFKNIRLRTLSSAAAAAGDDFKKFQGTWEIASAEVNGSTIPSDQISDISVIFDGNSYRVERPEGTDRGTFKLDGSKKPAQMDIQPSTGNDAGRTIPAIFEFDGDSLQICYAIVAGTSRPTEFKTEDDSGRLLVKYKRKK